MACEYLFFPGTSACSDNPYGELLYRDMPSFGVEVHVFSLWQALWGRYDVFHLHWPEYYLNRSLLKALFGSLLVLLSTAWLRGAGYPHLVDSSQSSQPLTCTPDNGSVVLGNIYPDARRLCQS